MKNLLKSMALGVGVFSMLTLASCSNEESVTNPEPKDNIKNGLTIYIPNMEMGTKATYDANQSEAAVQDLWFYAFKTDGSSQTTVAEKIESTPGTATGYSDYTQYTVTILEAGAEYYIYVLANIGEYLESSLKTKYDAGTLTKDEVEGIIMNFSAQILAGHLPMACYYTEVKSGTKQSHPVLPNNKYTFNATSADLFIDLSVLCAKVRYTILFDNDSFSSGFGSNVVDFETGLGANNDEKTKVTNLVNKVAWQTSTSISDKGSFTAHVPLNKVLYPTGTDKTNYEGITSLNEQSSVTLPDLTIIDGSSVPDWTTPLKQRAWQGVTYLPEGTTATSKLSFTESTNYMSNHNPEYALYWTNKGLERGNFYDIVFKIKTPSYIEFAVYVKVNAWTYHAYGDEW